MKTLIFLLSVKISRSKSFTYYLVSYFPMFWKYPGCLRRLTSPDKFVTSFFTEKRGPGRRPQSGKSGTGLRRNRILFTLISSSVKPWSVKTRLQIFSFRLIHQKLRGEEGCVDYLALFLEVFDPTSCNVFTLPQSSQILLTTINLEQAFQTCGHHIVQLFIGVTF